MQKEDNNITNYNIDLRIYGTVNNKAINEIVKITKYNNDYKVVIINMANDKHVDGGEPEEPVGSIKDQLDSTIYIKNDKAYAIDNSGKYVETTNSYYDDPDVYMIGLNNAKKVNLETEETIGEKVYKVYEVVFSKDILNRVLEEAPADFKTEKDGTGKIYIDDKGYVYRIIYNIDKLTVNANYYGVNTIRALDFPEEIK
jgi:nitrogen regulatory protein PII